MRVSFKTMILMLVCTALVSCKREKTENTYCIKTINLTGQQLRINDVFIRYPFRVRLSDNVLYVMDLHGTENCIHQFSYPGLKHLKSIGKIGNGPGEILDSENIRFDSQNSLWLLDANQKKLISIQKKGQKQISLEGRLIRTLDFDLVNDSLFVVPDYTGKHRYNLVNQRGKVVKSVGSIPNSNQPTKSDIATAQAWRSFIDYNPKNSILAVATQLGEVLEVYDLVHDSLINTHYGHEGAPKYYVRDGVAIPNGIMGYSDVYVGDKLIYALFWGSRIEDVRRGKIKKEGGDQIHVFDLKGALVKKFKLDHFISGFCIDEVKKQILALDVNSDQPLIMYLI